MSESPAETAAAESSLDAIVRVERELNARLAAAKAQAEERLRQAETAAAERLAGARRRIAGAAAAQVEQHMQAFDTQLAREAADRERDIAQRGAALAAVRGQLRARVLDEVLGT